MFFSFLALSTSAAEATAACNTSYSASNFTRGGVATDASGTITLTPNSGGQFGAIWNKSRVNLSSDFCVSAEVYLGADDYGADGLAFVMQPNSVAAGGVGGGLGYAGITPSFAVEYDTYYNGGDLYNDHVGLMKNGNVSVHNLWGVNAVDVGNIEDNQWRKTKVYWDSTTDAVSVWLDKNADGDLDDAGETLFNAVSANLEGNFSGEVYWGFTAATGGAVNLQQVRNIAYTGVARVNAPPTASTEPVLNNSIVINQATVIPFIVADDETTQAQWSFTKTSSNTTVVPLNAIVVAMSSATNGTITITPATAGSSTVVIGIQDADGSALSYTLSVTATGPSLDVASLLDDGSSGTLRWAITQANATAGGIYDAISFSTDGVITLTSALPQITQSVTVTGNGRTQTVIDGNNLYRLFNVASGRTLNVSNMTLKQGQATNGGLIFNGSGTVNANNIRFTGMSSGSAVFNNNNGSTATYTDSTFDFLGTGIGGDYGSTPQLAAGVTTWANEADSVFTNKTYVINSVFTSNTYGINNQRFTKIENSQFTSNSYGAAVMGLNRTQILNSTFTSNSIGIYHNSWIPTTFNMGTNLRLMTGNTFTNNGVSIYLDDGYNNGQKNQSWVTITGNSWDANGVWVRHYQWNGTSNAQGTARPYTTGTIFTQNSNTFPDTIGAPTNLTATDTGAGILLDWDAPVGGGYLPERYAISWSGSLGGGGIATGNAGDANALNTSIELSYALIYSFGEAGETFPFDIRSDNDTFGKYSALSNVVSIQVGTSPTTTTSSTTTTTVYVAPVDNTTTTVYVAPVDNTTTTVYVAPVDSGGGEEDDSSPTDTTEPPYIIPLPETESTTATLPTETLPETEETTITVPVFPVIPGEEEVEGPVTTYPDLTDGPAENDTNVILLPDTADTADIVDAIDDVDFTEITDTQFDATIDAVFDDLDNPEDVGTVLATFLDADISDTQLDAVLDKVFDGPMTADDTTEILEELLDGPVTVTQLESIMDKVFEDISDTEETVAVLTNLFDGPLSNTELETVMDSVFSEDATVDQMSSVVADLLDKELDEKELDAVFDAAFDDDLSDKETIDLIVDVLEEGLTSEALGSALGAVFDEEVSTEVLVETFTAVLGTELNKESVGVIVDVLESNTISNEQVSTVVTLIIEQEGGVDSEQATELATSSKVLESIDGEQATEVFDAVVVSEVTEEAGAQIAAALIVASTEVKASFEEEINVFAGVFDTYVALGSNIDVGDRRTILATSAALTSVAAAGATVSVARSSSGAPAPTGAPSGNSGSAGSNEPAGEIAYERKKKKKFTRNSIYKYPEE